MMPMPDKAHYDEFRTTELRFGGKWTCPHVPVQAEGRLSDGRPWYFRARCGEWAIQIDEPKAENAWRGRYVDSGDDPWDGFMPAAEAAARIHRVLRWHDRPLHAAAFGCNQTGETGRIVTSVSHIIRTHSFGPFGWEDHYEIPWDESDVLVGCTATDAIASTAEVRGG